MYGFNNQKTEIETDTYILLTSILCIRIFFFLIILFRYRRKYNNILFEFFVNDFGNYCRFIFC